MLQITADVPMSDIIIGLTLIITAAAAAANSKCTRYWLSIEYAWLRLFKS